MRTPGAATFRIFLVAVLAAAGLAAPACSEGDRVYTAANPAAKVDGYRSFSFGRCERAPRGYHASLRSPEVERRAQRLITAALVARGYVPAAGKGDFFVVFGSGHRLRNVHETSGDASQSWLPNDENAEEVEGSVVIDAFDSMTGRWLWHGAIRTGTDPGRIEQGLLRRTVTELMATFPVATAR